MICPYNRKTETQILQWTQSPDSEDEKSGQQITKIVFRQIECHREGCGAWHDGQCHYTSNG